MNPRIETCASWEMGCVCPTSTASQLIWLLYFWFQVWKRRRELFWNRGLYFLTCNGFAAASFFGLPSPQPYKWMKSVKKPLLQFGMNFAHGGTGVLDTMVSQPNMTAQIDLFQGVLEESFYTEEELNSSLALISVAGNDYAAHILNNGNEQVSWQTWIPECWPLWWSC